MAGINDEWHSKRRQFVKIGGVGWLKKLNTIKNGATMNDFVVFEDYLGNAGKNKDQPKYGHLARGRDAF